MLLLLKTASLLNFYRQIFLALRTDPLIRLKVITDFADSNKRGAKISTFKSVLKISLVI